MRIYFSGIGGMGLGPLAMLSQDMGHDVVGSDAQKSDMSRALVSRGVSVSYQQDGAFLREQHELKPIDMLVFSSALQSDHPELKMAKELGINATKRDALTNQLMSEKNLKMIAVAGTHGKTTTTAMLAWLMQSLAWPVAHLIGTSVNFAPSGRYQEGAEYLIYEADEYDRHFLSFKSTFSLLTSLDYDHADIYTTEQDYMAAFKQFIDGSDISVGWKADLDRLGVAPSNKVVALDRADYPGNLGLTLPGEHNRMNASLIAELMAHSFEIDHENSVRFLNEYPGSARRFEKIIDGLYSDYAHHPREISATIQLAKEVAKGKLVVIYQPHQNIRQHQLVAEGGYSEAFKGADHVHWLPTFLSREDKSLEVLIPEQLMATATEPKDLRVAALNDELAHHIMEHLDKGDTVLAMSAGDLDTWLRDKFGPNQVR